VTDLSPQDALALRVGRVAREHATLDNYLRTAHTTLVSPGLGVYLTQSVRRTGTLVEGCMKMLGKADVPEAVLDAGKVALRYAATVNTERNEVVHGVWIRAFKDDGSGEQTDELRWMNSVGSASSTPHDLASLDGVVVSLERASVRIIGLIEAVVHLALLQGLVLESSAHPRGGGRALGESDARSVRAAPGRELSDRRRATQP
jgi:hypothetical protein